MAKLRNKDTEIEELKARNIYLENKNKIFTSMKNMSEKNRMFLVILWVMILILLSIVVTYAITDTTKNPIIGTIEGREWKVSESTNKSLLSLLPQAKGDAFTSLDGDRASLSILLSSGDSYTLTFTYRNGRIVSLFKGELMYLEYTETVYGGGRTLTLFYRNGKVVFKEKR